MVIANALFKPPGDTKVNHLITSALPAFWTQLKQGSPTQFAGYLTISIVVLVWAGFALSVRAISSTALAPADVAMIRFLVPALVLLPWLPQRIKQFRQVSKTNLLLVLIGGVPFFLIASAGGALTSAAYVGTLIAGTSPLFVAMIGVLFFKQSLSAKTLVSLGVIVAGAAVLVLSRTGADQGSLLNGLGLQSPLLQGVGYLLSAAIMWAAYTIGLKRSGLDAIGNALLVAWCSPILLLICVLTDIAPTAIGQFSFADAFPFIVVQGLGVGVIATVGYSYAINLLGAEKSATIGSFAPVLTALLAVPLLGESVSPMLLLGIGITVCGVILATRSQRAK